MALITRSLFGLALLATVSCRREPDRAGEPTLISPPATTSAIALRASLLTDRPYRVVAPAGDKGPAPLVLVLHGYGGNGASLDDLLHLTDVASENGIFLAVPDGSQDAHGARFWNATDACCNFYGSTVDDVAYLAAIIADMKAKHSIDSKRVFVVGFSNGGFMAHRLACELSPEIAAIATLGAMSFKDDSRCHATEPVAVLEMNGDADRIILIDGGLPGGSLPYASPYPSAGASIQGWASRNKCSSRTEPPPIDVARDLPGSETTVERWTGCAPGGAAELWTIHGAPHIPRLSATWSSLVLQFLASHPKP
ncbi:MAG: PHB depolymerase family esterase [Polyangiaceae bacterium]